MNKIIEKKPMQMYGIDDFISEMKLPMPYVDIMARIHYLTGYNKSALILLHQHAEWIVPDDQVILALITAVTLFSMTQAPDAPGLALR